MLKNFYLICISVFIGIVAMSICLGIFNAIKEMDLIGGMAAAVFVLVYGMILGFIPAVIFMTISLYIGEFVTNRFSYKIKLLADLMIITLVGAFATVVYGKSMSMSIYGLIAGLLGGLYYIYIIHKRKMANQAFNRSA